MNLEQVQQLIDEHVDLIILDAKGLAEAKDRCGKFLWLTAVLTSYLKDLEIKKAKVKTLERTKYFEAIQSETDTKQVTEKKLRAEGNVIYTSAREALEEVDALRTWIRGYVEVFNNAHVTYRQYSRE